MSKSVIIQTVLIELHHTIYLFFNNVLSTLTMLKWLDSAYSTWCFSFLAIVCHSLVSWLTSCWCSSWCSCWWWWSSVIWWDIPSFRSLLYISCRLTKQNHPLSHLLELPCAEHLYIDKDIFYIFKNLCDIIFLILKFLLYIPRPSYK